VPHLVLVDPRWNPWRGRTQIASRLAIYSGRVLHREDVAGVRC